MHLMGIVFVSLQRTAVVWDTKTLVCFFFFLFLFLLFLLHLIACFMLKI